MKLYPHKVVLMTFKPGTFTTPVIRTIH
jgi:hypothetical protein